MLSVGEGRRHDPLHPPRGPRASRRGPLLRVRLAVAPVVIGGEGAAGGGLSGGGVRGRAGARGMGDEAMIIIEPRCHQCERTDCPLLSSVIVGLSTYLRAVGECYRARLSRRAA